MNNRKFYWLKLWHAGSVIVLSSSFHNKFFQQKIISWISEYSCIISYKEISAENTRMKNNLPKTNLQHISFSIKSGFPWSITFKFLIWLTSSFHLQMFMAWFWLASWFSKQLLHILPVPEVSECQVPALEFDLAAKVAYILRWWKH
jgi:hypothetical protein